MRYEIRISSQAKAALEKVPEPDRRRIRKAISALANDPYPQNSRALSDIGTKPDMPMAELKRWLKAIAKSEYIPTRQAAEEFGLQPATLRHRARRGSLLVKKAGREWRFNRAELQVLAHGGQELMDEVDDLAFAKFVEHQLAEDPNPRYIPLVEEVMAQLDMASPQAEGEQESYSCPRSASG